MTTIELYTRDQEIFATSSPVISSGDKNSVKLKVTFDSEWDSYTKTAVFYKGSNPVAWEMLLEGNECNIPSEVTSEAGYIFIGVRGIAPNNKVKTSALMKYNVSKGANGNYVYEPTDDIYKQILEAYNLEKARLDNLLAAETVDAELIDIRVGPDGTVFPTAGEAVRQQFANVSDECDAVYSLLNLNLSAYPMRHGYITQNNEWYYGNSVVKHILVPIVEGETYRITANKLNRTRYALLDYTGINFVDGYNSRYDIEANQTVEVTIPYGAKYLYFYATSDGTTDYLPALFVNIHTKKTVSLDFGSLTDGYVSVTDFNCCYEGNLMRFTYETEGFFKNRRTTNYISARDFLNVEEDLTGFIYEYNSFFDLIRVSSIKQTNTLNPTTRYVKLHVVQDGGEVPCSWTMGGLSDDSSTTRIKTEIIPINSFDFVIMGDMSKLFYEFYDAEGVKIGGGNGISGHFINRDMIRYRFKPDTEEKTYEDVAYIKLSMGYLNNGDVSPNDAPKIHTYGDTEISSITISTNSDNEKVPNKVVYDSTLNLMYPVKAHNDNSLYYGKILIRFPKNYTNDGKPTKLIFFKTGSRGFQDIHETSEFKYIDYIKYWVDEGYAVMDCHGGTSKYPTTDAFGMPTNIASVRAAWDFITENYNIDKSGIYISAKSLGGYTAHQLIFNGNLPVKAAALLAPAIDNKRYCFGYYRFQRINFAEDAELEGDISVLEQGDDTTSIGNQAQHSEEFKTLIKNNVNKLTGYLPMCSNVINKSIDELLELNAETENSFADVVRIVNVPTRYWVAKDDTDTPYNIADNFVKSCQNSGSPVTIRTMPNNTGGHHSVDYAENAPKTTITTRLGVTYEDFPVAWVEALNFLESY